MPKINRPHSIVVKVTADERDAITRLALKEKMAAANWLRSLGMAKVIEPEMKPEPIIPYAMNTRVLEEMIRNPNPITEITMSISSTANEAAKMDMPITKSEDVTNWKDFEDKVNSNPPIEEPTIDPDWASPEKMAMKQNAAPKPMPAESRMYEVIAKRSGKAQADNWLEGRRKEKSKPAVIGEPQVPQHLRAFYDSLVKNQGQAQADFWLLTNSKGVKLAP